MINKWYNEKNYSKKKRIEKKKKKVAKLPVNVLLYDIRQAIKVKS